MSGISVLGRQQRIARDRALRDLLELLRVGPPPAPGDVRAAIEVAEEAVEIARLVATRFGQARDLARLDRKVERARRIAFGETVIYVVLRRDLALVKIGITAHLKQRVGQLRRATGCPHELLLAFRGTVDDERRLHTRFAGYRRDGEWFAYSREVRRWVNDERERLGKANMARSTPDAVDADSHQTAISPRAELENTHLSRSTGAVCNAP